jgi:hypothetical protein
MCPCGGSLFSEVVVHVSKFWRGLVVTAAACALASLGLGSAMAQSVAAGVTVSIAAQSHFKPVTGDTFVEFAEGKNGDVTLKGSISGATTGDVAVLYAQPWPYKKAPAQVPGQNTTLTVTGTTPVSYSFTTVPQIATRYSVQVLTSLTSTPALGSSKAVTVYVVAGGKATGLSRCGRPTCRETWHIYTIVPASLYKAESAKRVYFYFALNLSRTGEPKAPKYLYLDRSAKISKVKRIKSSEFERTITWSFKIGDDGYYWLPAACTKDSESKDGLNLPGSHGCGDRRIRSSITYLG